MKRTSLAVAVALGVLAVPAAASAASDRQICESNGGDYSKVNGYATCTYPAGNSDRGWTYTQQGSYKSSHPLVRTNPGGHVM